MTSMKMNDWPASTSFICISEILLLLYVCHIEGASDQWWWRWWWRKTTLSQKLSIHKTFSKKTQQPNPWPNELVSNMRHSQKSVSSFRVTHWQHSHLFLTKLQWLSCCYQLLLAVSNLTSNATTVTEHQFETYLRVGSIHDDNERSVSHTSSTRNFYLNPATVFF